MKRLLPFAAILLPASLADAHPASGIAVDAHGRIFVAMGSVIMMLDSGGKARAIVSDPKNEKFFQLHQICRAPDGGLLTASDKGDSIWRFTAEGALTRFYPAEGQALPLQVGIGGDPVDVDGEGNVYAVKSDWKTVTEIMKITPRGEVTLLAGGQMGHADGTGAEAKFGDLHGSAFAVGKDGSLFLTDGTRYVRKITRDGKTSTLAGAAGVGFADGPAAQAKFSVPVGLAVDANGVVLVADTENHRIRKITPDGMVSTLAGSGARGATGGPAFDATFDKPTGVTIAPNGDVYVLEVEKARVRKITKNGEVTTVGSVALPPSEPR